MVRIHRKRPQLCFFSFKNGIKDTENEIKDLLQLNREPLMTHICTNSCLKAESWSLEPVKVTIGGNRLTVTIG